MHILRILFENWRNFKAADAPLQQRVFLTGPNASGKSNLLDAIRFLRDVARADGGLQKAVSDRGGVPKIRCLAAGKNADVKLRLELGDGAGGPRWVYELSFNEDRQGRPLVKGEVIIKQGVEILKRPDLTDQSDRERLTQTHLEQVNANRDFRQIAAFFGSIDYLHIVPHLVRDSERRGSRRHDPLGADFVEQLAATSGSVLDSRLRRISEAIKIAVPQFREMKLERDELGAPHLHSRYEHWQPEAGWQAEEDFSDGTLRLIGLLWAVTAGSGPLLLEEPELSLHPSVVRFIPQMLGKAISRSRSQIILSTHSPELLRDAGIATDEVLLLLPSRDGTKIRLAKDDEDIQELLLTGEDLGSAILQKVAPERPDKLARFM